MRSVLIPVVAGLTLFAAPLQAGEFEVVGGVTLGFMLGGDTGKRSDLNPHVEAVFRGFYAGVAADIYNDGTNTEISPYLGYRNQTAGGLSYDLSYSRSILPNDGGDCCGSIDAAVDLPIGGRLMAGLDMGLVPETGDTSVDVGLDVAAFDRVTLSASAGVAGNDTHWEVGADYLLSDSTNVKASYHDGSDTKPYVGLDLTWNFTLLGN